MNTISLPGNAPEEHNLPIERTPSFISALLQLSAMQFHARLAVALLEAFQHDPRLILGASDDALESVTGMIPRYLERVRDNKLAPSPAQIDWYDRNGVQAVLYGDPDYPRLLQSIPDPPAFLFYRGALHEKDQFAVAIVGSRRATGYGRAVADKLARDLAFNGVPVVSGGAVGIDAAAHRAAVRSGGRTLAVLGCGLDVDYPSGNQTLFTEILENGALISEYPPGTQPEAWRFPARNRLISGLSLGVVVVEAPRSSGALITSRWAIEHNRTVFSVPGNIDRATSEGTNNLLKEGAVPVTCCADILGALGFLVTREQEDMQQQLQLKMNPAAPSAQFRQVSNAAPAGLSELRKKVLATLSLTPRPVDSVAVEASITVSEAGVELTMLELDGLAVRLPGNMYVRVL